MSDASKVKEMLVSSDSLDRIRGINRASELDSTSEIVSSLVSLATKDGNQQVRYVAISRLANLDSASLSEEEKEELLTAARYILMNDSESSCQAGAADLIAGLRLSEGFDDLIATFNTTSDWMLKFSIAAGLGEMGDPKAFDFLVSALDREPQDNFLLVSAIIGSLGELGDERGESGDRARYACEEQRRELTASEAEGSDTGSNLLGALVHRVQSCCDSQPVRSPEDSSLRSSTDEERFW
ncbi:phycocyanobilin lyase [Gracilaria domingensis]|nr:phycocyanobilin lyase [Gracilaria domingensis]